MTVNRMRSLGAVDAVVLLGLLLPACSRFRPRVSRQQFHDNALRWLHVAQPGGSGKCPGLPPPKRAAGRHIAEKPKNRHNQLLLTPDPSVRGQNHFYFQLQLGIKLSPSFVSSCCWVPSASMDQISV